MAKISKRRGRSGWTIGASTKCEECSATFVAPRASLDAGRKQVCPKCRGLSADGSPINEPMNEDERRAAASEMTKSMWESGRFDQIPAKVAETNRQKRAEVALKEAAAVELSEKTLARMRGRIQQAVEEQLEQAHKAIMGHDGVSWTPTQARVFGILINKVLPDLHQSQIKQENSRPLADLSQADLEAIIAQAKEAEMRTIDHQDD